MQMPDRMVQRTVWIEALPNVGQVPEESSTLPPDLFSHASDSLGT